MILYIIKNESYIAICKSFNDNFSWASVRVEDFYTIGLININLSEAQEDHILKDNKALVWTENYKSDILKLLKKDK